MKHIVCGQLVEDWISAKVGRQICQPCVALGVEIDGEVVGAAAFNNWTGPNVFVTVAGSPKAWTRIFLRRLARYVFGELKCERVTLTTEHQDVAALCRRLGGQHEGTLRSAFGPGRDGLIFGILRSEWRI
jgi:RimJ/RimL family protein N-acetyltransferase